MFGRKYFLEPEIEDWHIDCWVWLIRHGSSMGLDVLQKCPLILPTSDFFPGSDKVGHARADHIFQTVRSLAGMHDWPVRLVEQRALPDRVADLLHVEHTGTCAGTFRMEHNHGLITYDPKLISKPVSLIATFAHELGHYLNGGFAEPPPDGWDLIEPATDVTSSYLGFGVFGANTAFTFSQFQQGDGIQGWQSERIGYLTEAQWIFDLAIFCVLSRTETEAAKPHLKSHVWKELGRAMKYVEKHQIAQAITKQF